MAGGMQWIDGQLQWVGEQGTQQFYDQGVPGAAVGMDPAAMQPVVDQQNDMNAQAAAVQVDDNTTATQQATTELTDAQKAEEEQRKAGIDLEKAKLAEQKAALDRADKEAGLGMRPEPEAELPIDGGEGEMVFSEEEGTVIEPKQGLALYDQGSERRKEAVAGAGGAKVAEMQADAAIDEQMGQARRRDLAADDALMLKRQKLEQTRTNIDNQLVAEIESDVKKPSPSALSLIGVFLNGLVAPMQGGRNAALEIVHKQMQREVDVDMENKRKRMQGLQKRRGIAADAELGIEKQQAANDVMMAKKYKAVRMELEARLKLPSLTAQQLANTQELIGQLEQGQGAFQLKAAQTIFDAQLRAQKQANAHAIAMAKANKKKGGGGKGSATARLGEDDARFGAPIYYDVNDNTPFNYRDLDEKQRKAVDGRISQVPLTDTKTGQQIRGIMFGTKTEATEVTNAWEDVGNVKARASRVMAFFKNSDGTDRLDFAGFGSEEGAKLTSEFTQLMIALKDNWDLGAIQAPDMKLIEGVMSTAPGTAWAGLSTAAGRNQMKGLMNNLASGETITMKGSLTSKAQLPDGFEVKFPRFDYTKDIKEDMREQKPATVNEIGGNAMAVMRGLNEGRQMRKEAPGIYEEDPGATYEALATEANKLASSYEGGTDQPSKAAESGGKVGIGQQEFILKDLLAEAKGDKRATEIINKALSRVTKAGKIKRASAAAKRVKEKREKEKKELRKNFQGVRN